MFWPNARHNLMTHRYEEAGIWFLRMRSSNRWSHALYTYIAGVCYAELSCQYPESRDHASKATSLLESVPNLLQKRKSFGGKRIPFEQLVERKLGRFRLHAGCRPIVEGVSGPVTEELTYLLCNGQKRMGPRDLEKSLESLQRWEGKRRGDEETIAIEFMKSVIDRNAGRLDRARQRMEANVVNDSFPQKVRTGSNDWLTGFAYYEVYRSALLG